MLEHKKELSAIKDRYKKLYFLNKINDKQDALIAIENDLNLESNWNNFSKMNQLMKEKSDIVDSITIFNSINSNISLLEDLLFDNNIDSSLLNECEEMMLKLQKMLSELEIQSIFSGEHDKSNTFLEINAGAGGVDSQDWVIMLLRMYTMWFDKKGFKYDIIDKCEGEVGGLKSVSLNVIGKFAFGLLKNETGTHRLVRISPFNANDKRQTSFAGVFCYPEIENTIDIQIDEKDLRVDVYRSSGAGGQHVNKTESAVRITHLSTGIVVQSQVQRSQIQNRENCMKMLHAKLYELEKNKNNAGFQDASNEKNDISWGNQIRNYVLHPYKMVKDLRSSFETGNVNAILDGDLDDIINSVLMKD